jgi:hypothetical protein
VEPRLDITVDEWLIDCLSPWSDDSNLELVQTFIHTVKVRCDRLVFTHEHSRRCQEKVNDLRNTVREKFYYPMVLHPLTELLYDSRKVDLRSAVDVVEMTGVPQDDVPVVQSVLAIGGPRRLLITTDARLTPILSEKFRRYGVECLDPESYLRDNPNDVSPST